MTGYSMFKDVKVPVRPGMPAAYQPQPRVEVHTAEPSEPETVPEAAQDAPEPVAERIEPVTPDYRRKRLALASSNLRDALFGELRALRDGKSSPQQAMAVAKVSQQIIAAIRMEVELTTVTLPGAEDPKLLEGA